MCNGTPRLPGAFAITALAGLTLVVEPWNWHGDLTPKLWAVASGFGWAAGSVATKYFQRSRALDPLNVLAWQMFAGVLPLTVLAYALDAAPLQWDVAYGLLVLYVGAVSTALGFLLWVAVLRFLPADDAHVRATIETTIAELAPDGFVYRYLDLDHDPRQVDGLSGREATFAICSFWLVDNLALAGDTVAAHALFERMLASCNDVGLLAEEIDTVSGELRGNFPQAFSHVGLIGAAINLQRAERRRPKAGTPG